MTEHFGWTGGSRDADIEHHLRRVWHEDATCRPGAPLSKVLVFCNKSVRDDSPAAIPNPPATSASGAKVGPMDAVKEVPHVLITTPLLSRRLDFSPDVRHIFIVDEPRNMVDS